MTRPVHVAIAALREVGFEAEDCGDGTFTVGCDVSPRDVYRAWNLNQMSVGRPSRSFDHWCRWLDRQPAAAEYRQWLNRWGSK